MSEWCLNVTIVMLSKIIWNKTSYRRNYQLYLLFFVLLNNWFFLKESSLLLAKLAGMSHWTNMPGKSLDDRSTGFWNRFTLAGNRRSASMIEWWPVDYWSSLSSMKFWFHICCIAVAVKENFIQKKNSFIRQSESFIAINIAEY